MVCGGAEEDEKKERMKYKRYEKEVKYLSKQRMITQLKTPTERDRKTMWIEV
jgi:hypothetical protein